MTAMTETKLRDKIAELGKSLFERGMSAGSSGNISVRLDDGWLLTPTNSCLGRLEPARIAKLGPDGRHVSGDAPSKELFLHGAMYQARASAKAIVHLHSTHSVAVSCLPEVDPHDVLPPLTAYYVMKVGRLPLVPYYRPGDERLGAAIRGYAAKSHALLLANHGPIVAGTSLEDAVYAMEELEETAKLYLLLHGRNPRWLTEDQIAELEAAFPS
jgi:ribulose-5-phosphate 4-epimerase/fuculose-1-phosphate aldolase